jgi:SAM-dependent methyltransferase
MEERRSPVKERRELYRRTVERLAIEEVCEGFRFSKVLDFGCGRGWLTSYLAGRACQVVGLEVQADALAEARKNCQGDQKVLLMRYGGGGIPLRAGSVDLLLAVGVVRSLLDRGPLEDALQEWHRCLRPGGSLILIETDNRALRRYLGQGELRKRILRAGLEVLRWYPIRKVSWWGGSLVKWGVIPRSAYPLVARWELHSRRRPLWAWGKRAYLGEIRRPFSASTGVG